MSFTEFPIPSTELSSVAVNARIALNAMENSNDAVNNAIEADLPATLVSLGATDGENGASDAGKLAKFDTNGALAVSQSINLSTAVSSVVDADAIGVAQASAANVSKKATLSTLWSWIVGKIGAITSITAGGNWTFGGKVLVGTAQATAAKLTVTDNTADDAVRITQTGTGNALVVEDSANPDTTPFVISSGGQVYIGKTTSLPSGESWPLQITGGTGSNVGCVFARFSNDAAGSHALSFVRSRSGTNGSYGGIVQNGDQIGTIQFSADDGTSNRFFSSYASVRVDGEPQAGSVPSRMMFGTTPVGGSATERMRITSAGKVGIGTTAPASKLHVLDGSTDAALTVTQTGAGDALVVQDVAGDSTPFVIDSNGRVVIGKQSVLTTTQLGTPIIQHHAVSSNNVGLYSWDVNASNAASVTFSKSQSGTVGTNAVIADGADIGRLSFRGDDGADFYEGARILAEVDGLIGQFATSLTSGISYRIKSAGTTDFTTFGAADNNVGTVFTASRDGTPSDGDGVAIKTSGEMPGRLSFWTTEDGNGAPTERMRITRAGNVGIGTTAPASNLHVNSAGNTICTVSSSYPNSTTTGLAINTTGNSATPRISFDKDSVTVGSIQFSHNATAAQQRLAFNVAGGTEKLTVLGGGNVGINTTTPESRLHVVGDLTMQSATIATTATAGTNGDVPAQVVGYIQVKINGTNRKIPYYAV